MTKLDDTVFDMTEEQIKAHPDYIGADSYTVIEPGLTGLAQDQTLTHKEFIDSCKTYGWGSFAWLPDLSDVK